MDFTTIYNIYWQKVFRLCMGYMNNYAQAQDATQDIFVIVWKNLPKFRHEANIGTWIFRIATNYCLRQIEKDKRTKNIALPTNIVQEQTLNIEPQIQQLLAYISELPKLERIIISLELEDIKQADIADILGLSLANVRVKIHRIKNKLSHKFKAHHNEH